MKPNAVVLLVSFALAGASAQPVRAEDPVAKPPEDVKKALAELDKDFKVIDAKARKEKGERLEKTIKQLQEMQESYTKAGKLDEAVAVRELLKRLKEDAVTLAVGGKVLADPGSLRDYRGKNGEEFYFKVTGSTSGRAWGSGVYTDDSNLATAAVHAGVLKAGETGIVKVTIVEGQNSYDGSMDNEVTTSDYGRWEGSFKVETVKVEKK